MIIAAAGSRCTAPCDSGAYLPENITEIVSGGAKGVDSVAREYALSRNIKLTEFLPEYEKNGKAAPIKRNERMAGYADEVFVFWDGKSRGTKSVKDLFEKAGKRVTVICCPLPPENSSL